jgi:hypothetical protein
MLNVTTITVVAAALAAFATSALAQNHNHGDGHAQFHKDFYQYWKEPGNPHASCCNARIETDGRETGDCEPTQARVRNGHWEAWVRQTGRWEQIPDEKILKQPNPNIFDAHLCWTPSRGTICFVPPDTGG